MMQTTLNVTEALLLALIKSHYSHGMPFTPYSIYAHLPNYISKTAMARYCLSLYDKGYLVRLDRQSVKARIYYSLPSSESKKGLL